MSIEAPFIDADGAVDDPVGAESAAAGGFGYPAREDAFMQNE